MVPVNSELATTLSAKPRLLADGFKFTEGPAADADGNIYFVDIGSRRVHFWHVEKEELSLIRENSGGADGMFVDAEGSLWICEMHDKQLSKINADGQYHVVLDSFEGQPFTGPNDLWFDDVGGLYFTDSYGGHEDRGNSTRVFYFSPSGELSLLEDDYYKSNGLQGSPDGRWLYIADYLDDKIYRYAVDLPGKLTDRTLFCEVRCDGMTVDERGNLYLCTGNYGQGVVVVDPEGQICGTIEVAEDAHNICFGGPNYSTLYITATQGLYALDMQVRGAANGSPRRIRRDFGGLDKLIAPDATPRLLSEGYHIAQGPAPLSDGNFIFADIHHNRILRWDYATNTQTVICDETRGGDGLAPMLDGTILVCELTGKRLCRIEVDGSYSVVAEAFEGEPFTGVNDIFVDRHGGVYFSDSYPGLNPDGKPEFCDYYMAPGSTKPERIVDDLYKGKSIHITPDEKWIYIDDFAGRVVYRYELLAPGQLGKRTRFIERMVGGMTLDEFGNLYLSTVMDGAGVVIYNPEGDLIGQILVPQCTTNVAFTGPEGKTLVITTFESIYALDMQIQGFAQTHGYPVAHRR